MARTTSTASCCVLLALLLLQTAIATGFNYGDALDKSLLFFEAQRSGKLPSTRRVKWRGDSGLGDGFKQGVDLVGGYYDAGDHVKFGLPMAYSVTMLSWGVIEYRKDIAGLNEMGNALSAIKWGTDYFIKAHSQYNTLWGQVGDGDSDHYCWERAEDMTTSRTAYKVDANSPGSDLAGETAAALAAASIAFKPYNSSYSNLLLLHAKQLFTFADSFRGLYDDSITIAKNFYTSSGYSDELLWAATWLFQATNDQYYLKYVADNAASMGGTGWAVREFSWDNKYAGVQILLSKVLLEGRGGPYTSVLKQYQAKADFFACSCAQKNNGYNVDKTPGGLVYVREWNNLQYAASAAFITAVYSDYLSQARTSLQCPDGSVSPQELLNFAKSQADYILGKNPKSISYLVGYGKNYPRKVHHRGSTIASTSVYRATVGCVEGFESWYRRSQADPNTLYGALVGGPSKNDEFNDDRSNYEQTEPTISGTAPLIGLFSKLASVSGIPGSYHQKWPLPHKAPPSYYEYHPKTPSTNTKPGNYKFSPKVSPAPYTNTGGAPIQFFHSITDAWTIKKTTYYRHKVVLKNKSHKSITDLKLRIENLTGSVWGLTQTKIKHVYQLPQWINVLKPGSDFSFVYVQGGPQAKVVVQSYH